MSKSIPVTTYVLLHYAYMEPALHSNAYYISEMVGGERHYRGLVRADELVPYLFPAWEEES